MFRGERTFVVSVIAAAFFLSPMLALAAGLPSQIVPMNCVGADAATTCGVCDVAQLAQNVLNTGIFIAVFLSAVLFAWAGWEALTSSGDAHKYEHSRSIFGNVVIGLVIIMVGWIVIDTLMKTLTNGSFGPWNKVCEAFIGTASQLLA